MTYKQNGLSITRGHFAWWLFWWLLVSAFRDEAVFLANAAISDPERGQGVSAGRRLEPESVFSALDHRLN